MTRYEDDLTGVQDPDFLAIGLGGTNMMAMLWTVAMGRRAVGVEMRGNPFLGVHWNIRAEFYHQLGVIDDMMLARYGEEGVPSRLGRRLKLAELFYGQSTVAGDIIADSIVDGYDTERHIAGTIQDIEFIDDRWRDGVPTRHLTLLQPPAPPREPDPAKSRRSMVEVLDGPSTFQGSASSILILLRRYLEKIEEMDMERGVPPRVRLFLNHRVVPNEGDGFLKQPDGRYAVRIEQLQELDYAGRFVRIRTPGSVPIDIGVPELFMIAEGFRSTDAERLGFLQQDVTVDHGDGRGPIVAQADFLAGLIEVLVGGRLRRRIASEFDEQGREYWVRQIAVGHENDPEVGWILVQVPDFKTFDPVLAGRLPAGTDPKSPEYFAAYDQLVHEYYMDQISEILELPAKDLKKMQMVYGPKMFSLVERMGDNARLAGNGVVGGDSFGNGHFLTSGGAMTAMVGHGIGLLDYWTARDAGTSPETAIEALAAKIKEDTLGWLHVSASEYSDAVPINFGAERIRQITEATQSTGQTGKSNLIDSSRRTRHSLLLLNPSDWRRPLLRSGRVFTGRLPELHAVHPALRRRHRVRRGPHVRVGFVASALTPNVLRALEAALGQPGVLLTLVTPVGSDQVPAAMRERLAGLAHCANVMDAGAVESAFATLAPAVPLPELVLAVEPGVHAAAREAFSRLLPAGAAANNGPSREAGDRVEQRVALAAAGIPIPHHAALHSIEDGLTFAEERGYFPLQFTAASLAHTQSHRVDNETELMACLTRLAPSEGVPVVGEAVVMGEAIQLAVMCIGGTPAWAGAARVHRHSPHASNWSMLVPREPDEPADSVIRQMAYRAVGAIGMDTGIGNVTVTRTPDGSAVVTACSTLPPDHRLMRVIGLAHGADLYRAWATCTVNGVFTPIPRVSAAGLVVLQGNHAGRRITRIDGWEAITARFATEIVDAVLPEAGTMSSADGDGWISVRHADSARVAEVVAAIAADVQIILDS